MTDNMKSKPTVEKETKHYHLELTEKEVEALLRADSDVRSRLEVEVAYPDEGTVLPGGFDLNDETTWTASENEVTP